MAKSEEETDAFSRLYKKTEFDNLLLKLGGWSRFQQIQWVLLFLAAVPQGTLTPQLSLPQSQKKTRFTALESRR